MIKIFKYFSKKELGLLLFSVFFIVCQVWLDLKMPDYMSEITKLTQTLGSSMADIWLSGGKMMLCALGSLVASFIVGFFAAKAATGLAQRLRSKVYAKTIDFGMQEVNHFSISSLITRTTNDITGIQQLVAMGIQVVVKAPILAVWAIIKISGKNIEWTMATGAAVAFLIAMISIIIFVAVPKTKAIQKLTDNLNSVTRENITGIRVVRSFNAENFHKDRFEKANNDLTSTNLFVNRVMGIMHPSNSFMISMLSLSIYWIGAYLINGANMIDRLQLFIDMVVFGSYALQIIMAFTMMTMIFIMLPRASVSANRINEVLDTETNLKDGTVTQGNSGKTGEIVFENVCFRYPDAQDDVLHNISFKANSGETVAIIGSTGSGKSSLSLLIPRFFDVTFGEILVDGVNVKDYTQKALRQKIGFVHQKAVLFKGTVNSNIAYGDSKVADSKIAADIAQASEFISGKEEGFDSQISQGGTNLSGGQRQRISIARAIYRNPEIYVFDDSFSALDYKTDRMLRKKLNEVLPNSTKIIIAQRVGTIKNADRILVLDKGEIVGMGKHSYLIENCNVYKEIALSQLSEEDLKHAQL